MKITRIQEEYDTIPYGDHKEKTFRQWWINVGSLMPEVPLDYKERELFEKFARKVFFDLWENMS